MSNADIRKAHKLLDYVSQGRAVLDDEIKLLRSFLPDLPKQKTLEEIHEEVYEKWLNVEGDEWDSDNWGTMEEFLGGLQYQLKDLIDAPAAVPALPAGMRLADHEVYGRVVVSPGVGVDRCHEIFYLDPGMSSGTDISEVEPDSLTFIDAEPAKPVHPEFLDSPEDYKLAPNGTIVVYEKSLPWVKRGGTWLSAIADAKNSSDEMGATPRRALRWGWGE